MNQKDALDLPQSSYIGRHAELYDLFYAEKPYQDEASFVHRCIQTHKPGAQSLLELACGTGTHSLLLEKLGYEIVAVDYSHDMLEHARKKAKEQKSQIDFKQQDMRALDLPGKSFDAVICLFDSLGYVATNENILQVLKGIHRILKPDGVFVFEFWHAGAMLRSFDPLRVRRFKTATGEIERLSETSVDYIKQLCHVSYTIHEMNADGTFQTIKETQVNRFFLVQEMNLFLTLAGFAPLKWHAGFTDDETINADTWHIVCVARKENPLP